MLYVTNYLWKNFLNFACFYEVLNYEVSKNWDKYLISDFENKVPMVIYRNSSFTYNKTYLTQIKTSIRNKI